MVKKNKAFSLIELSIVILTIGILIAGVIQGSKLVGKFKRLSSQTLTQSSPVASITNLILWLEPVMEESFLESETKDGDNISQWNDINPHAQHKYTAVVATASDAISYEQSSAINGLPSVLFSPTLGVQANRFFSLQNFSGSNTAIKTPDNEFSFCLVSRATSKDSHPVPLKNGNHANGWSYATNGSNRSIVFTGVGVSSFSPGNFQINVNEILCTTYDGSSNGDVAVFINGSEITLGSSNRIAEDPTETLYIGSNRLGANPWTGNISELIVYSRSLKNSERRSLEEYLGQKYDIKIAQ